MDESSSVDFKFMESYLKDKFLKPFARRLTFLYFGFDRCEDIFVLSDTEDLDFKYCESMQTTGLIKIKNLDHLSKVNTWFDHFLTDRSFPCIFYFSAVAGLLNKIKWDESKITIQKDSYGLVTMTVTLQDKETQDDVVKTIMVSRRIDTYFTLTKLQAFVDKYSSVFFKNEEICYDKTVDDVSPKHISNIDISCQDLYDKDLLDVICEDVKLVLLLGLDLLVVKSLIVPDKDYYFRVRLWADHGKKCINYGSLYTDTDISICTSRDNIFIFPNAKKGLPS